MLTEPVFHPVYLPVFKNCSLSSPIVFFQGRAICLAELLQTVDFLADKIPKHQHLLNLYEERYYFLLGFLLGLKQQSISLFPSTVTPHVLTQLRKNYAELIVLSEFESEYESSLGSSQTVDLKELLDKRNLSSEKKLSDQYLWSIIPDIEAQRNTVIIFTSGSTGQPKPYIKQWHDLISAAEHLTQDLFSNSSSPIENSNNIIPALLATVPAQHMYGLEASIMVALQNGFLLHSHKPFFPQDITQCLEELTQHAHTQNKTIETSLITTPLHLKACIKTEVPLPGVKQFISATAPLQPELAQLCEQYYTARVMEIFGCTEVGSMAYRRTIETDQWAVLEDISLNAIDEHDIQINTTRSIQTFLFNDVINLLNEQHFILKGRKEDLINLAGKRTSLAYLNHHLQSYEELRDGCFYLSSFFNKPAIEDIDKNIVDIKEGQLVAFVVLTNPNNIAIIDKKQMTIKIRAWLKQSIDSIFLPKKIYFVDALPRNATGKLPQAELKKMQEQQLGQ